MEDCLFCRIARGDVDADILHNDEQVIAFSDINPQAPVHFLVIPRKHIVSLLDLTAQDEELLSRIFEVVRILAEEMKVAASGIRVLSNVGRDAEQVVQHLHFHVMGGRRMHWPPG